MLSYEKRNYNQSSGKSYLFQLMLFMKLVLGMLFEKFYRFIPQYAPEWGSGGIFGLRYHKDVLYFNLAFEAEVHLIRGGEEKIYEFELVGRKPTSGGDTYNAVDAVDDFIFFGGWVHAPAIYDKEKRKILFYNKYSHVHRYDIREDEVNLLWKETIAHETNWAGEISEIIYDPVNDRLLLARGDGHKKLGVYSLSVKGGKAERLSDEPALKGTIYEETACFNMGQWFFNGFQYVDLVTGKLEKIPVDLNSEISVDNGPIFSPFVGSISPIAGRLFVFVRGGIFVGTPLYEKEKTMFARLFDFPETIFSPFRSNALKIGGGALVAYNAFSDSIAMHLRPIVAPTVLVYVTPPQVKVVGVYGSRITSLEKCGDKILVASNTMPNFSKSTPNDVGYRDITVLEDSLLHCSPPPLTISLKGEDVEDDYWGGIPLTGYKSPRLIVKASKENALEVYEYDLALPISEAEKEMVKIEKGRNIIDLSSYSAITSFKLLKGDPKARIIISLK